MPTALLSPNIHSRTRPRTNTNNRRGAANLSRAKQARRPEPANIHDPQARLSIPPRDESYRPGRHLVSRPRLCFFCVFPSPSRPQTTSCCIASRPLGHLATNREVALPTKEVRESRPGGTALFVAGQVHLGSFALYRRDCFIHCPSNAGSADPKARQETARHGELPKAREDRRG